MHSKVLIFLSAKVSSTMSQMLGSYSYCDSESFLHVLSSPIFLACFPFLPEGQKVMVNLRAKTFPGKVCGNLRNDVEHIWA